MKKDIHVWHLEITDSTLIPDGLSDAAYELKRLDTNVPEYNRFLYVAVGASVLWYMRLVWTYKQWEKRLATRGLETWVAYVDGLPIGYFELEPGHAGSVEIAYFGLLPQFIGKGFGKCLLNDAIYKAWTLGGYEHKRGTKRVWLHTCTLDHPNALPNYLNRGFSIFREEDLQDDIPNEPIQPWPGARLR